MHARPRAACSALARMLAVITTAAMLEAGKSAWCREQGLYPSELAKWCTSVTTVLGESSCYCSNRYWSTRRLTASVTAWDLKQGPSGERQFLPKFTCHVNHRSSYLWGQAHQKSFLSLEGDGFAYPRCGTVRTTLLTICGPIR